MRITHSFHSVDLFISGRTHVHKSSMQANSIGLPSDCAQLGAHIWNGNVNSILRVHFIPLVQMYSDSFFFSLFIFFSTNFSSKGIRIRCKSKEACTATSFAVCLQMPMHIQYGANLILFDIQMQTYSNVNANKNRISLSIIRLSRFTWWVEAWLAHTTTYKIRDAIINSYQNQNPFFLHSNPPQSNAIERRLQIFGCSCVQAAILMGVLRIFLLRYCMLYLV